MAQQIAALKQSLSYGGYLNRTQGQAGSNWGLGTSPYATNPAPAEGANQVQNREGSDSLGNTPTTDYEPLYAPEDIAHGFATEDQLHGQFDMSQPPQKVEEVRSAPEDQEAITGYADIIGAYVEGEESAIQREKVPLEYQELVRQYFNQLEEEAAGKGEKPSDEESSGKESSSEETSSTGSEEESEE